TCSVGTATVLPSHAKKPSLPNRKKSKRPMQKDNTCLVRRAIVLSRQAETTSRLVRPKAKPARPKDNTCSVGMSQTDTPSRPIRSKAKPGRLTLTQSPYYVQCPDVALLYDDVQQC
ncbi:hypothetical protein LSAT2_020254, partial [Lamellibrachia satsuma]